MSGLFVQSGRAVNQDVRSIEECGQRRHGTTVMPALLVHPVSKPCRNLHRIASRLPTGVPHRLDRFEASQEAA